MENRARVQQEFERQAATFEDPGGNVNNPEVMAWIVSRLRLRRQDRVLDVAAGTGLLSRAVARKVRSVVALDVTAAMLAKARSSSKDVHNIQFVLSDAEQIPFSDAHFDMVMTRLSFHHMSSPEKALAEMVRVAVPSGRIAVIDLVAPNFAGEHESYDHFERLRDPSHTRTLTQKEFEAMLAKSGLSPLGVDVRDLVVELEDWLAKAQTPSGPAAQVRNALRTEMEGGVRTGLRPFRQDGKLMLHQSWGVFVARRP